MLLLLFLIPYIKRKKITFEHILETFLIKTTDKRPRVSKNKTQALSLFALTLLLGYYGGFHGGGVGTMLLLGFYFLGKANIVASAATTKIINIALSLTASYVYFTQPNLISWHYAFPLLTGTIFGSFLGVKWAEKLNYRHIRILIYLVVGISAIRFILFA